MHIPGSRRERFVSDLVNECLVSRDRRIQQANWCQTMYYSGADTAEGFALYNKTYAYIDELISLLFSPVGLRFVINSGGTPSALDTVKNRIAAQKLRSFMRAGEVDSITSDTVEWSLVKGKALQKVLWKRDRLEATLIQPEMFGVLQENRTSLDSNMEAFVHCSWITPHQFARMIWAHPDRDDLMKKMRRHMKQGKGTGLSGEGANKPIVIGGLYPFQPAGTPMTTTRGIVDWMAGPAPVLAPETLAQLLRLDELWVWDDARADWATFQLVGDDMLIMGKDFSLNALAFNPKSGQHIECLTGHHPFIEFCPNRTDGFFWGRPEIVLVAGLQEMLNSRINGINALLRLQEQPSMFFKNMAGVNQAAVSRFRKPGGYLSDTNPQADVKTLPPEIAEDLWASIHEYERMFDELGGLPPIAKGRGESGVRSQGHAETLVRMFSPRFKDRALLVERSVDALGNLALELARAHCDDRLTAWVPAAQAGVEVSNEGNVFELPPAPGDVPVKFTLADLPDDVVVRVDSHSSSPAFAMEARALAFDLFKIGAMDAAQLVDHVDAPEPETLIAGIERRAAEKAAFLAQHPELVDKQGGGGKRR